MSDTRILVNFTEYTRLVRADEIMALLLHLSGKEDAWKAQYVLEAIREMYSDENIKETREGKADKKDLLDIIKKFGEEMPCSIGSF